MSRVSFASPAIGYLSGPALLMTTDGGLTWHAQPGPQTEVLTIGRGRVYRVAYTSSGCPGPCQPALLETAAGSAGAGATWRPTAAPPHGHWLGLVAAASPATIAVATGPTGGTAPTPPSWW